VAQACAEPLGLPSRSHNISDHTPEKIIQQANSILNATCYTSEPLYIDSPATPRDEDRPLKTIDFKVGDSVRIHGLVTATDMNGVCGICELWDEERLCWHVRLSTGKLKRVRAENLEKQSRDNEYRLASYGWQAGGWQEEELNGTIPANVQTLDDAAAWVRVMVPQAIGFSRHRDFSATRCRYVTAMLTEGGRSPVNDVWPLYLFDTSEAPALRFPLTPTEALFAKADQTLTPTKALFAKAAQTLTPKSLSAGDAVAPDKENSCNSFFFYEAGAFLRQRAPCGQTWEEYCVAVVPNFKPSCVESVTGPWAECLHAAIVCERSDPKRKDDPNFDAAGPIQQVMDFFEACGHSEQMASLEGLKVATQSLFASDGASTKKPSSPPSQSNSF